jgi:hypothetical protein
MKPKMGRAMKRLEADEQCDQASSATALAKMCAPEESNPLLEGVAKADFVRDVISNLQKLHWG